MRHCPDCGKILSVVVPGEVWECFSCNPKCGSVFSAFISGLNSVRKKKEDRPKFPECQQACPSLEMCRNRECNVVYQLREEITKLKIDKSATIRERDKEIKQLKRDIAGWERYTKDAPMLAGPRILKEFHDKKVKDFESKLIRMKDKLDCPSKAELIQKARELESFGFFF